jgi:hypothetical protein
MLISKTEVFHFQLWPIKSLKISVRADALISRCDKIEKHGCFLKNSFKFENEALK